MSIYQLKSRFQSLLRPAVTRLHSAGVTANQVTIFACVVSVGIGLWLYFARPNAIAFALIPAWMLLRMALNAVDGMLAREFHQKSTLGAFLNELTDVDFRRGAVPALRHRRAVRAILGGGRYHARWAE